MPEMKVNCNALVEKSKTILVDGFIAAGWKDAEGNLSGIYIDLEEPTEKTYPFILIKRPEKTAEEQISMGNVPEVYLIIPLLITTYRGGDSPQTQKQITDQAYDIMAEVENIIRNNITWDGFTGIIWALPGGFAPQTADPGFYKLGINIDFRIKV